MQHWLWTGWMLNLCELILDLICNLQKSNSSIGVFNRWLPNILFIWSMQCLQVSISSVLASFKRYFKKSGNFLIRKEILSFFVMNFKQEFLQEIRKKEILNHLVQVGAPLRAPLKPKKANGATLKLNGGTAQPTAQFEHYLQSIACDLSF